MTDSRRDPPRVAEIAAYLESLIPLPLAEAWDNVGLLVGRPDRVVVRAMTCLTVTPETAAEAIAKQAQLVVSHHPLPFKPLARITTESPTARLLLDLVEARVAVYSAHTAYDSAAQGVNQQLAERLGLLDIRPLIPHATISGAGTGRIGSLSAAESLDAFSRRTARAFPNANVRCVGRGERQIRTVGVGCGAAGDLLGRFAQAGCDAMVIGEARFHECLAAEANGMALVLLGHFASERFAQDRLANVLAARFPSIEVWASVTEGDPLKITA